MKYAKILGLLAVAAAAMMAFAASASATEVTSPTGTLYTGEIHAEAEHNAVDGGPILHGPADIQCTNSTVSGTIETHGSTTTAHGPINSLTFTNCNPGQDVTVLNPGRLIAHTDPEPGAGKYDGTLTSDGAEVLIHLTSIGITCLYTTEETDIGTLTSSDTTEGTATLDIEGTIPRTGGSIFCGSSGTWTGSYEVTTPDTLYID